MSEPFIGEIKMVGFGFAPRDWTLCNGALLAISQNQALFSLIGTQFGGDGKTTFQLPDLRGRAPVHTGALGFGGLDVQQGQRGGEEQVTLTAATLASHTHAMQASRDAADQRDPGGHVLAKTVPDGEDLKRIYGSAANLVGMNAAAVTSTGGGAPHTNIQPIQVVNFCIALRGVFPSRS